MNTVTRMMATRIKMKEKKRAPTTNNLHSISPNLSFPQSQRKFLQGQTSRVIIDALSLQQTQTVINAAVSNAGRHTAHTVILFSSTDLFYNYIHMPKIKFLDVLCALYPGYTNMCVSFSLLMTAYISSVILWHILMPNITNVCQYRV